MDPARKNARKISRKTSSPRAVVKAPTTAAVAAHLRKLANRKTLDGMSRYAIPSDGAYGVPVGKIRDYAKELGRQHTLALSLWKTGQYEARMLAAFLADPALMTPQVMDASWRVVVRGGVVAQHADWSDAKVSAETARRTAARRLATVR